MIFNFHNCICFPLWYSIPELSKDQNLTAIIVPVKSFCGRLILSELFVMDSKAKESHQFRGVFMHAFSSSYSSKCVCNLALVNGLSKVIHLKPW